MKAQFQLAERGSPPETVRRWAQHTAWEEGQLLAAYRFNDFVYLYEHSRIARAQVLIAWARHTGDRAQLHETLAYLQRQQQIAEASNLGWYLIKLQLLQALTHHALGEIEAAWAALSAALDRAKPEGFVRLFVDEGEPLRWLVDDLRFAIANSGLENYLDTLLAAFDPPRAITVDEAPGPQVNPSQARAIVNPQPNIHNLVEPLTAREQEVLQLVAAGLANTQIAARLVVTVGTVKSHINHIFSKLDVRSRTQAVARGRELGLLTD